MTWETEAIETKDVKFLCKYLFDVDLTPYQELIVREIAFKEHKRITICAFTRYGKTFCVALGVLLYILFNTNKKIGLIAPTNKQTAILRNYIAEFLIKSELLTALLDLDLSGVERLKKEVSKTRITFKNNITLQVLSAEGTGNRMMGFGFDVVVVDESCLIAHEVYRQKISRMLGDSVDSMLVEIGNPWHKDNQMWEHWIIPDDEIHKKIKVDYKIGFEEERISRQFLEEQRADLTPIEFRILYEAEFPDETEDALLKWKWIKDAVEREF